MPGGGGVDLNPIHIVENIIKDPLPTIGGIAGGFLGGPIGAAIGSGGLSLAEGKKPGQALTNAALSGLGTFAAGELFGGGAGGAAGGAEAAPWVNPDTGLTVGQAGLDAAGGSSLATGAAGASGIPALSGSGAAVPDLTIPSQAFGGEAFIPGAASEAAGSGGISLPSQAFGGEAFLPQQAASAPLSGAAAPATSGVSSSVGQPPPQVALPTQAAPNGSGAGFGNDIPVPGVKPTPPATGWFDKGLSAVGLDPKSGAGQFLSENKNLILPGLALGGTALQSLSGPTKDQKELQRLAQQFRDQGASLSSYLQNGTLPPGAQAGLDSATASAKAAIRSKYASMGMSGSSSELAELNAVDRSAAFQAFQYADKLLQSGIQESGLAGNLYNFLLQHGDAQDKELQQSIADFAAAAAGGGGSGNKGVTLRLG